jgi:hypothetical protein
VRPLRQHVSFTFMKPKLIIAITLLTNLSLGNFLLPLGKGKYETVAGFVTVHLVISVIAIILILYLFSLIKTSTKKIYVLSGPIIMSYLVPLISVYVLFGIGGFIISPVELKVLIVGIPIAFISSIVSWPLWLPLGLLNSGFYYMYSKALQQKTS